LAVRIIVSVLVIWHVTAVFLAPLSVSPSSPLVVELAQKPPMQWYLDILYLNHGYHFFAPDPSTGHLIQYQVYDDRGAEIAKGTFPDKKEQWPRLRYHRYFMLADQCEMPIPDDQNPDRQRKADAERQRWERVYLTAYGQQLLKQYNGATFRVQRIIHYPAFIADVQKGMPLDDRQTYKTEIEVQGRRQDAGPVTQPAQNGAWNNNYNNMRRDVASGWQGAVR
jgi:hypothetical protein